MSEVTSVNGMTGAVVLGASDVGAVASSSEGEPNGVATLNSSGKLPETQLPTSVVSSSGIATAALVPASNGAGGYTWTPGAASTAPFNVLAYGAKGDGVTNDTAAIQAAVTAAGAAYAASGKISVVLFPSGYTFLHGLINASSGVYLWCYGATFNNTSGTGGWTAKGLYNYPSGSTPNVLSHFAIFGGTWVGTGAETTLKNMYLISIGESCGCQDIVIRDTFVSGWGATTFFLENPTRIKFINNTIIAGGLNNPGFQNEVTFDLNGQAPSGGQVLVAGNHIHNAVADSISMVSVTGSTWEGGPVFFTVVNNIVTADPPTADAAGFTKESKIVTDINASSANVGKYVTASILGVEKVTYIEACVPGISYTLSKAFTGATGEGILYVGVYRNSIVLELDSVGAIPVTDVLFANNNVTGYERGVMGISGSGVAEKNITGVLIQGNILTNKQANAAAAYKGNTNPQGTGISLAGSKKAFDVNILDNIIHCTSPVPPIAIETGSELTNNGSQSGNRFSTGASQGRAVLVAGTVTVNTIEIQAGDNVLLSRVVAGGTIGELSLGTVTAGTSFVINSSLTTDTSTIYWRIDH